MSKRQYPTEPTPEILKAMAEKIKLGLYPFRAAVACGISGPTHIAWMARGVEETDAEANEATGRFGEYRMAIQAAEAEAQESLLVELRACDKAGAWQRFAWLLERRYKDEYAQAKDRTPAEDDAATKKTVLIVTQASLEAI